ncbi:hypothetical protein B0H19DRAFT_1075702 [Mycena capillaripes]|nr:hypothetical protein B0H19DRAFT_1075702 [Mycena capillaripes]
MNATHPQLNPVFNGDAQLCSAPPEGYPDMKRRKCLLITAATDALAWTTPLRLHLLGWICAIVVGFARFWHPIGALARAYLKQREGYRLALATIARYPTPRTTVTGVTKHPHAMQREPTYRPHTVPEVLNTCDVASSDPRASPPSITTALSSHFTRRATDPMRCTTAIHTHSPRRHAPAATGVLRVPRRRGDVGPIEERDKRSTHDSSCERLDGRMRTAGGAAREASAGFREEGEGGVGSEGEGEGEPDTRPDTHNALQARVRGSRAVVEAHSKAMARTRGRKRGAPSPSPRGQWIRHHRLLC